VIASRLRAAARAGAAALMGLGNVDAYAAGDAKAGRAKAQMCQACHGSDGMSTVPDAPNIAGQVEGYLATQLRAFKSGARKNEAMSLVVAGLSDQDIDNLAAWYSSIEVKVGKLPGG
jgi:cytochrome c553